LPGIVSSLVTSPPSFCTASTALFSASAGEGAGGFGAGPVGVACVLGVGDVSPPVGLVVWVGEVAVTGGVEVGGLSGVGLGPHPVSEVIASGTNITIRNVRLIRTLQKCGPNARVLVRS
jgi:hypothetical protein